MAGRREMLDDRLPSSGVRGPTSNGGGRSQTGTGLPYVDDPLRVRSSEFIPSGYLRNGYDTGRVW